MEDILSLYPNKIKYYDIFKKLFDEFNYQKSFLPRSKCIENLKADCQNKYKQIAKDYLIKNNKELNFYQKKKITYKIYREFLLIILKQEGE